MTVPFAAVVLVRLVALVEVARPRSQANDPPLADAALPRYSVLVPVFDEAEILPSLIDGLARLDYPPAKLDIVLVLEEADLATKAAMIALRLPANMRLVVVPDGMPRTKPKALNYAMQFTNGEYIVVFDAEDRPEPDQLRRAAAVFASSPAGLACLQARLNIYNVGDSWFTRQFTVEYSALFDAILPALDRLGLPVPLGGTSNHFPRAVLEEIGGWDPFNVTEDADLGIRLARLGWHTAILDSTTWEEAPQCAGQWLRQRTRWLKGWLQTSSSIRVSRFVCFASSDFSGFWVFTRSWAGLFYQRWCIPGSMFCWLGMPSLTKRGRYLTFSGRGLAASP